MTQDDKDKVISKIQKLLALAESANEHEAALAAERAQAILAQHNLSLDEIKSVREGDADIVEDASTMTKSYPWRRSIAVRVAELYFCKYFYRTIRNYRGNARSGHDLHCFVGSKQNIAVAKVMFAYLEVTVGRLARQAASTVPAEHRASFVTSFTNACAGRLCIRIKKRIEAAKRDGIQGEGGNNLPALASLYDRVDLRLSQYLDDHYPDMKETPNRAKMYNIQGAIAGAAAGDRIGLDQQVNAQPSKKLT